MPQHKAGRGTGQPAEAAGDAVLHAAVAPCGKARPCIQHPHQGEIKKADGHHCQQGCTQRTGGPKKQQPPQGGAQAAGQHNFFRRKHMVGQKAGEDERRKVCRRRAGRNHTQRLPTEPVLRQIKRIEREKGHIAGKIQHIHAAKPALLCAVCALHAASPFSPGAPRGIWLGAFVLF